MSNPASAFRVDVEGIQKHFGATHALNDVSLSFRAGEIHAVVGENGAGKSTLGKVIAGVYSADRGTITVGGAPVERWNPGLALKSGIAMIAQELALVPDLTVAQNVFLGAEEHVLGVERRNLRERFMELDAETAFGLDPDAKVRHLRIADQQKVEILRSLARDARVIVMDEPTSSLTSQEMAQLEQLMRDLRDRGCCIIYVSHFLDSVLSVSDRITVMRDGRHIDTFPAEGVTKSHLVSLMLGRELEQAYPDRVPPVSGDSAPLLKVTSLRTETGVEDMSFEVHRGEIVGLLGLVGSGRSECVRAIAGVDAIVSGAVELDGVTISGRNVIGTIKAGLGFVPEDRHRDGLVLQRSVRENITLARLKKQSRFGWINPRTERKAARAFAQDLEVRPLAPDLTVGKFSGGNQQKVLLGKALAANPKVLILDEPTRGVDVGAKRTIYDLIATLAQQGLGVLLISSEHEEIMELASRAYLVSDGRTKGEIVPAESSMEDVLYQLFNVLPGEELADAAGN